MRPLSRKQILNIAERQGYFYISPTRYSARLANQCRGLCKQGLLREEHWKKHGAYGHWFVPVKKEVLGDE
jgi:hypothetical protein